MQYKRSPLYAHFQKYRIDFRETVSIEEFKNQKTSLSQTSLEFEDEIKQGAQGLRILFK